MDWSGCPYTNRQIARFFDDAPSVFVGKGIATDEIRVPFYWFTLFHCCNLRDIEESATQKSLVQAYSLFNNRPNFTLNNGDPGENRLQMLENDLLKTDRIVAIDRYFIQIRCPAMIRAYDICPGTKCGVAGWINASRVANALVLVNPKSKKAVIHNHPLAGRLHCLYSAPEKRRASELGGYRDADYSDCGRRPRTPERIVISDQSDDSHYEEDERPSTAVELVSIKTEKTSEPEDSEVEDVYSSETRRELEELKKDEEEGRTRTKTRKHNSGGKKCGGKRKKLTKRLDCGIHDRKQKKTKRPFAATKNKSKKKANDEERVEDLLEEEEVEDEEETRGTVPPRTKYARRAKSNITYMFRPVISCTSQHRPTSQEPEQSSPPSSSSSTQTSSSSPTKS